MTPVVEIPWPLALVYWTIRGLFWFLGWALFWTIALLAGLVFLVGLTGYRIGERIEGRRRVRDAYSGAR